MVKVLINDKELEVQSGITVIQALEQAGVQVPRFCYHDKLKIAGNCRMCLVEIAPGPPKPQASCAINVSEGMSIKTETEMVKKAREGVMEFLLVNHPLDCPVCDQAGECDLQDQAFIYGRTDTNLKDGKRAVEEKNMGPLIKTQMTRCIHCTRCIRFMEDIAGTNEIGIFNRGSESEIATFLNANVKSNLSGNIIDLCPVGALTAKPYNSSYRPWELKKTPSIDIMDAMGSSIVIHSKGPEVVRILPRINEEINEEWLSDKSRFAFDGLLNQRIDSPYIKKDGKLIKTTFDIALNEIKQELLKIDLTKQFAAIAGVHTDAETIFSLKDLINKISCENYEGREEDFNLDISSRENYLFNSKITGIDEASCIVIVNSNIKNEAPVLNARIRRNIIDRKIPVYVIGEKVDLTYNYEHLGDDKNIITQILENNHKLCNILATAEKPMLIAGIDAFSGTQGIAVHKALLQIAKKYLQKEGFNGFNILHKNASSVAKMDAKLFSKGLANIIEKCNKKEIKVLYLIGADEIPSPLNENTFIIYQGSHGDKMAKYANIILPSTAYTEKSATYINIEGLHQKTNMAVKPVGVALDDVIIINKIANLLSVELNQNPLDLHFSANNFINDSSISGKFSLGKKSFYLSCYISRNSVTMARAEKELS